MPRFGGSGGRQLRDIAMDCRRAASLGRGLSRRLARNIRKGVEPMKLQVQANARAIPIMSAHPTPHPWNLRNELAAATWVSVTPMSRRTAHVRLIVDGKKMGAKRAPLPAYEEGSDGSRPLRWRHRVYGTWLPGIPNQPSHPYVRPAVIRHLPGVDRAVMAAVDETVAQLKGIK